MNTLRRGVRSMVEAFGPLVTALIIGGMVALVAAVLAKHGALAAVVALALALMAIAGFDTTDGQEALEQLDKLDDLIDQQERLHQIREKARRHEQLARMTRDQRRGWALGQLHDGREL